MGILPSGVMVVSGFGRSLRDASHIPTKYPQTFDHRNVRMDGNIDVFGMVFNQAAVPCSSMNTFAAEVLPEVTMEVN